jgi:hypothetical protein
VTAEENERTVKEKKKQECSVTSGVEAEETNEERRRRTRAEENERRNRSRGERTKKQQWRGGE